MAITIEITGDDKHLQQILENCKRSFANMGTSVEREGKQIESSFSNMAKGAVAFFSVAQAKQFVSQLIAVRGEFQQLEIAFSTMLKSKEKANTLMSQLITTAAHTPFDLQGIASSAKQLLAYGSAADKVNGEIIMLGNVAAGVSAPLGDIAYLYGTLRTQGRAYLMDIRQFAGRGIPIYEELSKVLGVSQGEVNKLVSAGKVGFPQIEQAFANMTKEGGKFHNLMQEQSKSLTGQISNLGDAWDMMFNEMGQSSEGAISSAISGVSYLVENYKTFGKILATIITTYGVYKASVIMLSMFQRINTAIVAQATIIMRANAQSTIVMSKAQVLAASRTAILTKAMHGLKAAFLSNPLGIILSGIALVAGTMWTLSDSTDEATATVDEFNESNDKLISNLDMLLSLIKNSDSSTNTYKNSLEKLNVMCKDYNITLLKENSTIEEQTKKYNELKLAIEASNAEKARKKNIENAGNKYNEDKDKLFNDLIEKIKETEYNTQTEVLGEKQINTYPANKIRENADIIANQFKSEMEEAARMMANQTEDDAKKTLLSLKERMRKVLVGANFSEAEVSGLVDRMFNHSGFETDIIKVYIGDMVKLNKVQNEVIETSNNLFKAQENADKAHIDSVRSMNLQKMSTEELNAELQNLKTKFSEIGIQINIKADFKLTGADKAFFNKMGSKEIAGTVVAFENALKHLQDGKKAVELKFLNGLRKTYTKEMANELVNDMQKYSTALGLRNNVSVNYDKKYNNAKKEWEEAKKTLVAIEKDKAKYTDVQHAKAKEEEKTAKENFGALGGDTSAPKSSGKGRDYRKEQFQSNKLSDDYSKSVIEQNKKFKDDEAQAVVDSMADGTDKEIAQIELDYKRKSDSIAKEQQSMLDAIDKYNLDLWKTNNPDKEEYQYTGAKATEANLSGSQSTNIANAQKIALDEQTKAKERVYAEEKVRQNEYLRDYGTFEEKKLAIANLYADRITNAKTKEDKDRAKKELEKEQKDLIESYVKFSSDYIDKIRENNQLQEDLKKGGVADSTLKVVKQINAESTNELVNGFGAVSQEYLDFCNGLVGISIEQLASKLATLQGQLSTADKSTGDKASKDKAIKMLTAQIKTLEAQIMAQATKKDVSGSNVSFTETIELMNDVTRTINTVIDGFDNMSDEAKNTSRSILSIATGSIGLIDGIQKVTEFGIQSMLKTTEVAGKSMSAVEKASVILTIITTAFQIAMAIMNLVNPDNKKEKEIQALQKQVDGLDKSYEKLDKTLEGAYSNDAKEIILDQEKMLLQQKALIQQQLALESSKKSPDDGKMDGFSDSLDEINDKLGETQNKIIEAVIGKDVNGAIEEFASKWVDAIGSGEDKAEAMKGVVRGMVKSAVTELVKSRMSGEVKAFMEYLAYAMEDGILVPAEERMLDSLQAKIEEKGNSLDKSFNKYLEEDEGRNASSKGIAQASQSSVDKLDGMVTTIQSHTYSISEQTKQLVLTNKALLEDVSFIRRQSEMLNKLERLDAIEVGISSMKSDISSMKQQGINIKR